MAAFKKLYATYYDTLYGGKSYAQEAIFFNSLIKRFGPKKTKSILSFGAGTLNHEQYLLQQGYMIDAIDIAPDMVRLARRKIKDKKIANLSVRVADMKKFESTQKYEAVLAMFNVVAYCRGISELVQTATSAFQSLHSSGVFIFDCWNAEAVRKSPPRREWQKFTQSGTNLYKLVSPGPLRANNSFERHVELLEVKKNKLISTFVDTEELHFWAIKDITASFKKIGYDKVDFFDFMKLRPVNHNSWMMTVVAHKK